MIRKKLLFLIFTFSLVFSFSLCLAQELETNYPEVGGYQPTDVSTPIPEYVKYIFNFSIWILGILSFGIVTWAGIRYLTSSGDLNTRKDAKKQIKAAFIGGTILLFSYLILTTINPQLIKLGTQELEKVEALSLPSPTALVSPDPLVRIKKLAENIKIALPLITGASLNLKTNIVDNCDCSHCAAECDCKGLGCTPIRCYEDPCLNRKSIEEEQKSIIITMDELLYYKNRMISEKEDISPELERFIYWKRLTEEDRDNLLENMGNIAIKIKKMSLYINKLSNLPNECIIPGDKCEAHCIETSCHDTGGCHPKKCTGGNPCPINEITDKINEINNSSESISSICEDIINILK